MAEKARKRKDGSRADKRGRPRSQGRYDRRQPKDKPGAPKAERAGRTKGKGGPGSPAHKDISAAELARNERPARGRQRR